MRAISFLLIFSGLIFAFPSVDVRWGDSTSENINILTAGKADWIPRCLNSGMEVRYRFEAQLCRRRSAWFDSCLGKRVETHRLSFDPITGSYRLVSDRLHDAVPPEEKTLKSYQEALQETGAVRSMPLAFLAAGHNKYLSARRAYVNVRVLVDCKGRYNETLAKISRVITLGLLRPNEYDSGWESFMLKAEK
ncbi:MAG: DUF4390 domain-containing protein [Candidatus Dadabacteria bacterium]|nr:MAG: DUF4390 domain-containing protein [Candidatus Dadabacteria bacterium]